MLLCIMRCAATSIASGTHIWSIFLGLWVMLYALQCLPLCLHVHSITEHMYDQSYTDESVGKGAKSRHVAPKQVKPAVIVRQDDMLGDGTPWLQMKPPKEKGQYGYLIRAHTGKSAEGKSRDICTLDLRFTLLPGYPHSLKLANPQPLSPGPIKLDEPFELEVQVRFHTRVC
jgi:hypothetical protein